MGIELKKTKKEKKKNHTYRIWKVVVVEYGKVDQAYDIPSHQALMATSTTCVNDATKERNEMWTFCDEIQCPYDRMLLFGRRSLGYEPIGTGALDMALRKMMGDRLWCDDSSHGRKNACYEKSENRLLSQHPPP